MSKTIVYIFIFLSLPSFVCGVLSVKFPQDVTSKVDELSGYFALITDVQNWILTNRTDLNNSLLKHLDYNYYNKTQSDNQYVKVGYANVTYDGEIDTEAELEGFVGDVTNIYTDNDGTLGNTTSEVQLVAIGGDEVSGTIGAIIITKNYNDSTEIAKVKVSNATHSDTTSRLLEESFVNESGDTMTGVLIVDAGGLYDIAGGTDTGDMLVLKPNSVDSKPFIALYGNGDGINLNTNAGENIIFVDDDTGFATWNKGGSSLQSNFTIGAIGKNLVLRVYSTILATTINVTTIILETLNITGNIISDGDIIANSFNGSWNGSVNYYTSAQVDTRVDSIENVTYVFLNSYYPNRTEIANTNGTWDSDTLDTHDTSYFQIAGDYVTCANSSNITCVGGVLGYNGTSSSYDDSSVRQSIIDNSTDIITILQNNVDTNSTYDRSYTDTRVDSMNNYSTADFKTDYGTMGFFTLTNASDYYATEIGRYTTTNFTENIAALTNITYYNNRLNSTINASIDSRVSDISNSTDDVWTAISNNTWDEEDISIRSSVVSNSTEIKKLMLNVSNVGGNNITLDENGKLAINMSIVDTDTTCGTSGICGYVYTDSWIRPANDEDTYIDLQNADQIDFYAGNMKFITMNEDTNDGFYLNPNSDDIDLSVSTQRGESLNVDGATGMVTILNVTFSDITSCEGMSGRLETDVNGNLFCGNVLLDWDKIQNYSDSTGCSGGQIAVGRYQNGTWNCTADQTGAGSENCSVEGSCSLITYDSELAYINNCSNTDSCLNIIYETELDDESELEAQLGDVSDVYTNNDGTLGNSSRDMEVGINKSGSFFNISIPCTLITDDGGGGDTDFCADTSGAGGGFDGTMVVNTTWTNVTYYNNRLNETINASIDSRLGSIYATKTELSDLNTINESILNTAMLTNRSLIQLGGYTDTNFSVKYSTMGFFTLTNASAYYASETGRYTTINHSAEVHAYISNCSVANSCGLIVYGSNTTDWDKSTADDLDLAKLDNGTIIRVQNTSWITDNQDKQDLTGLEIANETMLNTAMLTNRSLIQLGGYTDTNFSVKYSTMGFFTLTNASAYYASETGRYTKANLTSDYPYLDTDSTNDLTNGTDSRFGIMNASNKVYTNQINATYQNLTFYVNNGTLRLTFNGSHFGWES